MKGKGKVSVDEDPVESAEEPKAKKSKTDEDNLADDSVKMIKQVGSVNMLICKYYISMAILVGTELIF